MVIYFDLDDTLYRLYDPFYKAYQKVFHEDLDIYALWKQRSEEHTSELQSHRFISYAVFCLKKKKKR